MSRDKTTSEPWRTAYEGTATICTLNLYAGVVTRQTRVLVVQKYFSNPTDLMDNVDKSDIKTKKLVEIEESVSASSPITIFSTTRSNVDSSSPKKRAKSSLSYATLSNSGASSSRSGAPGTHLSLHPGNNKMSFYRRFRRSVTWIKKTISEKDCALIILVSFIIFC